MKHRKTRWFLAVVILVGSMILSDRVSAKEITVIGWNVESVGADPAVIAATIQAVQGCDIWGLSEVDGSLWANMFEESAAEGEDADFDGILGSTGERDRLLILYNSDLLEEVRHFELDEINPGGRVRAPLVAHFRIKGAGEEFLFMVNHLYRSKSEQRHRQASLLNDWAQNQVLPIIAVGDYNFDWEVKHGETDHDKGYDNLIAGGAFAWVRPGTLVKTQCSQRFDSVLDFIFVAGEATEWTSSSDILFPEPAYCPDDSDKSGHRPVQATFQTSTDEGPSMRDILLRRIQKVEEELNALKALVEEMDR
jgi:hypothetical protein